MIQIGGERKGVDLGGSEKAGWEGVSRLSCAPRGQPHWGSRPERSRTCAMQVGAQKARQNGRNGEEVDGLASATAHAPPNGTMFLTSHPANVSPTRMGGGGGGRGPVTGTTLSLSMF